MKIAVTPTVFIALGGTGQRILQRMRERLEHRVGTADLPFFRYVYVDSQTEPLEEVVTGLHGTARSWTTTNQISPSADTIARVQDPQRDNGRVAQALDINSWFDTHARHLLGTVNYAQGVGGRRMYSRLGFLASQNLGTLEQVLVQYYYDLIVCGNLRGNALQGIEPPYLTVTPSYVENGVRFVVVTSAGGGTGSGCFVDFGFFLRRLRAMHHWQGVHQFGHVALARPGVTNPQQQRNTAGLLTELEHYDGTQTYHARYLNLAGSPEYQDRNPPYDETYLLSATQGSVPLDAASDASLDQLLWRMAEFLVNDSVAVFADAAPDHEVLLPRSGPVGAVAFMGDIGLNPPGQQTYGVACREWPAALVHRHLYGTVIGQLSAAWGRANPEAAAGALALLRSRLGIPDEITQKNKDPRSLSDDRLKNAFLAPVNDIDPIPQLRAIRLGAFDEKKRISVPKLAEVQSRLRQQFEPLAGPPTSSTDPGVTYRVIRTNLSTLRSLENPESLPRAVAAELIRICTESQGGPATALQVCKDLRTAVDLELAYVEECLEGLAPSGSDSPRRLEECWQFANDRLLQEILLAKKSVYTDLGTWLGKLEIRLNNFTRYVREWAASRTAETAALPSNVPSLIIPSDVIQQLEGAARRGFSIDLRSLQQKRVGANRLEQPGLIPELVSLVEAGLPDVDARGGSTLFASDVPRQRGAVDFSYLTSIEQAIFRQLEQSPASPYREEVLTLLQQEAAQHGRPLPSLMEECQLLINFDTGATDYSTQPFAGTPLHITAIVQPNQQGYPAFSQAQAAGQAWVGRWKAVGAVKQVDTHGQRTAAVNPYTAAYVAERCSIQSAFIAGYDHAQRRALFQLDSFPAVHDQRVVLPPDPQEARKAFRLFLGSIVLNQWIYLGGQSPFHQLTYTEQDLSTGFPIERRWHAPRDPWAAARKLANQPHILNAIDLKVQVYLRDHMGAAATDINAACQHINAESQRQSRGDLLGWNLENVTFDAALDALLQFSMRYQIPLPKVPHRYAQPVEAGALTPGSTPRPMSHGGWCCTRCGHNFGVHMPLRTGSCPSCSNPFPPSAQPESNP